MPQMLIRVLLIEDTPQDAEIARNALSREKTEIFEVTWAPSIREGIQHTLEGKFDVVLLDLKLPDSEGLETIITIRRHAPGLPIVVLTSTTDDALAVKALHQGAQDYLPKGYIQIYSKLLPRTIRYAIERSRAEQQLAASHQRLEEFREMMALKDELIAKVSHELRTPLTSIKSGLGLLIDNVLGQTSGEQQEYLRTMDKDIDRLAELINNMLDISKIESGRMQLQRQRVDPRQLIETAIRSFKPLFGGRRVSLTPGESIEVFADPNRMLQVLGNVLSNAIKFTDDDGTIVFDVQRCNGAAALGITDSGSGIAAEAIPKLFQKFSQVSENGATPRGTGLGLVVCKELIELHRGRIEVHSKVGQGTTFTIQLPVYTAQLALEESFRELVEQAQRDQQPSVGLLITDPFGEMIGDLGLAAVPAYELDSVMDLLRRHVKQHDRVVITDNGKVAVLAITDRPGLEAIARRLAALLHQLGKPARFGYALCPDDAETAAALLAFASQSLRYLPSTPAPQA